MEFTDYTRFVLALGFVLGLIWLMAYLAKRFGLDKKLRGITGAQGRMAVVDVMHLDPKRKLTLVRVDAKEYVILLAGESAHVVDQFEVKA